MDNSLATTKTNGNTALAVRQQFESALREMVIGGRKLSPDQINGRMAFSMQQGLDPISEVHTITDRDGKTMAHTMSINGLRRKNQESLGSNGETVDVEFVEIAKEKMQTDWMYAFECRLRDSVSYRVWQKRLIEVGKTLKEVLGTVDYQTLVGACGPAPITVGVGVVYKSELSDYKDRNFNPIERAKKRAEVNARHHRFPTNAPVYDGEGGGMVIDAPYADTQEPEKPARPAAAVLNELYPDEPEMPPMNGEFVDAPPEPAQAPQPAPSAPQQTPAPAVAQSAIVGEIMPYEDTATVATSDGKLYRDIDNSTLVNMANAITKKLLKSGYTTPEEKAQAEHKLSAIRSILAHDGPAVRLEL